MAFLARLRVTFPDQPGALARAAAVIAEHGGNITAVDVHHSGVLSAIDDLTVEFPAYPDLDALRQALSTSGAATLLSHQEARPVDPVVAALRRAAAMISAPDSDPAAELAATIAEACATPVAWVSSAAEAQRWDAGRFAQERGGAIALRTVELPAEMAELLPGEVWLLAVPDPELVFGGRVVFVARPLSTEFTSTEIARIEALMVLFAQVSRSAAGHESPRPG